MKEIVSTINGKKTVMSIQTNGVTITKNIDISSSYEITIYSSRLKKIIKKKIIPIIDCMSDNDTIIITPSVSNNGVHTRIMCGINKEMAESLLLWYNSLECILSINRYLIRAFNEYTNYKFDIKRVIYSNSHSTFWETINKDKELYFTKINQYQNGIMYITTNKNTHREITSLIARSTSKMTQSIIDKEISFDNIISIKRLISEENMSIDEAIEKIIGDTSRFNRYFNNYVIRHKNLDKIIHSLIK
jgi:hypothetical protein